MRAVPAVRRHRCPNRDADPTRQRTDEDEDFVHGLNHTEVGGLRFEAGPISEPKAPQRLEVVHVERVGRDQARLLKAFRFFSFNEDRQSVETPIAHQTTKRFESQVALAYMFMSIDSRSAQAVLNRCRGRP